jgi:hypothetical protein
LAKLKNAKADLSILHPLPRVNRDLHEETTIPGLLFPPGALRPVIRMALILNVGVQKA